MKITKHAFSLVELVAAVAIVITLTMSAYIGIRKAQNMMKNNRMMNDLIAIESALNQYYHDHEQTFPLPDFGQPLNMNMLCFTAEAAFSECEGAAFYQGLIDNDLLTKRYLPEIPIDPWTRTNYAYGVSADGKYFMVAGIEQQSGGARTAYAISNLFKGYHLPSLIRAYNSQDFVTHKGGHLPYSPDPEKISARIVNPVGMITVTHGVIIKNVNDILYPGDTITTGAGATADIFFSDGSVSRLGENSELTISEESSSEKNADDNIVTKIKLKLLNGKIWNKVVRLAQGSEFNIETTSAIAGVRGTEFGACVNDPMLCPSEETVIVKTGTVEVSKTDASGVPLGAVVTLEVNDTAPEPVMINVSQPAISPGNVISVPPYSPAASYIESNETALLHPGIYPYILAFDIHRTGPGGDGLFVAEIGMNGVRSEDYDITGFEIFPKELFSSSEERKINEGVLNEAGEPIHPDVMTLDHTDFVSSSEALTENTFTYDTEETIYKIALPLPPGENRYHQKGLIVRAYRDSGEMHTNRTYSNFSWPSAGFSMMASTLASGDFLADFRKSSMYDDIADASQCRLVITRPALGNTNIALTPEFRWKMTGNCETADHYILSLQQSGATSPSEYTSVSASFPLPVTDTLAPETDYDLKISAYSAGEQIAKNELTFTTQSAGAIPPVEVASIENILVSPNPNTHPMLAGSGDSYTFTAEVAYTDGSTDTTGSECVWTADGGGYTPGNFNGNVFTLNDAAYPGGNTGFYCTVDLSDPFAPHMNVSFSIEAAAPTLADVCEPNGGVWNEAEDFCWILADAGASCDTACSDFGTANSVTSSCNPATDWNDDASSSICVALTGGTPAGTNPSAYAPFWADNGTGTQNCTPRSTGNVSCTATPPVITGLTFHRLCSCTE